MSFPNTPITWEQFGLAVTDISLYFTSSLLWYTVSLYPTKELWSSEHRFSPCYYIVTWRKHLLEKSNDNKSGIFFLSTNKPINRYLFCSEGPNLLQPAPALLPQILQPPFCTAKCCDRPPAVCKLRIFQKSREF